MGTNEIVLIISTIVSALSTGGLGGLWLNSRRLASQIKQSEAMNNVKIEQMKTETELQIERSKIALIGTLQEERTKAITQWDECEAELSQAYKDLNAARREVIDLKGEINNLNTILIDNGVMPPPGGGVKKQ